MLLVCAFALFLLSRTRHWLGRTAMLAPAALGLVAALASVIALAATHDVRVRTRSGAAEFELDLIGNGVAALLRPLSAHDWAITCPS